MRLRCTTSRPRQSLRRSAYSTVKRCIPGPAAVDERCIATPARRVAKNKVALKHADEPHRNTGVWNLGSSTWNFCNKPWRIELGQQQWWRELGQQPWREVRDQQGIELYEKLSGAATSNGLQLPASPHRSTACRLGNRAWAGPWQRELAAWAGPWRKKRGSSSLKRMSGSPN